MDSDIVFLVRIAGMAQRAERVAGGKGPGAGAVRGWERERERVLGNPNPWAAIDGESVRGFPCGQLRGGFAARVSCRAETRVADQAPKAEARPRRVQHKG